MQDSDDPESQHQPRDPLLRELGGKLIRERAVGGPPDVVEDQAAYEALCGEIEARCKTAGLKHDWTNLFEHRRLCVWLKSGREQRPLTIDSAGHAERILELPFEKCTVLLPYAAVCNYEERTIWAALTSSGSPGMLNTVTFMRRSLGIRDESNVLIRVEREADDGPRVVELGTDQGPLEILRPRSTRLVLTMRGYPVSNFDRARQLVEQVSDSLLFEIEVKTNLPLALVRDRSWLRRGRLRRRRSVERPTITFPKVAYDREPMSLYWYARQAHGMPLLEYLAYYQCIEFYFPVYAEAEARKRIRNALKDPGFDPGRDPDIARIVQILSARKGLGDERAQLRATLAECVDAERLAEFFADDEQIEFFAKNKELGVHPLPLGRPSGGQDLREAVAERIYQIRCKIVHTKGGDSAELLLPFSKEASLLGWDVDLIQFVARCALVAGSDFF